ncbi:protein DA1 isoform X2 [Citrus clementina]|uniref:protein DA1 isoform X2 n=1 Tax=Citrus clementina TaxID=85681 RepID=UPI000CED00F1|nr:protein DA1 isoform X2 [Citrus x clementina]
MAIIATITGVVLVAILLIRFIFEQEQDSEAHHQTQGLDFSNNNVGQYSNYPPATQFEYSEKDNMFENGNIKGSHGYTSISTRTTDDANYQYNNMVDNRFIKENNGQITDYKDNFLRDYKFENYNSNYKGQNYTSPPHPCYNYKMVITEEEFINLRDGRRLCRNCYSISMKDAEDCKLLFHLVRKFFGLFDLKLDERPILLTDEYEIMRLRGLKERANGVFASKESWVGITTTRIESWSLEGGEIKKITVPQKKTNKEAWVLLTFGYPKVKTGATLAHEMMHSWFYSNGLRGTRKLKKNVEEGICQVMSVRWTDWYIANEYDSDDQFVQKLIPFYQACRAQTDGYKEAWDVVQKHGLKPTLKQLVKTRKYPKR